MKLKLFSKYPNLTGPTSEKTKKYLWIVIGGVLLLLLAGWQWGRPWLSQRLEERSMRRVDTYLEEKDYRRAQLTLEQAVQVNPESLELRRRLATFYTRMGSPRALDVWSQLIELEPDNGDLLLSKAKAALIVGEVGLLRSILESFPPGERSRQEYLRLRAALSLAEKDPANLQATFEAMESLMPDDPAVRFGASALAMQGNDPLKVLAAREELLALARLDSLRIRATLQLIEDAGKQDDPGKALARLAAALTSQPVNRDEAMVALINYMQTQPDPQAGEVGILMDWMASRGLSREALWWLDGLNESLKSSPHVLKATANCQARLHQWDALKQTLRQGAWGAISSEVVRLLFSAWDQYETKGRARALDTWMSALDLISKQEGDSALSIAERLANYWNWDSAREKTLWRGHDLTPANPSFLRKLAALAEADGDSAALEEVYRAWTKSRPDDAYAWASRLYLERLRGQDLSALQQLANELMLQPDILPEVALIWAWIEAKQGRGESAMNRLSSLELDFLARPRSALLHTSLLVEMNLLNEALKSWSHAAQFDGTLPEEKALKSEMASRLKVE